jgi:transcriptional regulator with XRE-family HTH domain
MSRPISIVALNQRRIQLGMSHITVARRSGVSLPTVHRILAGGHSGASFANIQAIADALGLRLEFAPLEPADDLREKQANKKARELVRLVQGTSALEGQAVDSETIQRMIHRTAHELLAGSERKLWAD